MKEIVPDGVRSPIAPDLLLDPEPGVDDLDAPIRVAKLRQIPNNFGTRIPLPTEESNTIRSDGTDERAHTS